MSAHTPGPWETTEQFELDGVESIDVQCSGNRRREFRNGGYVICRGFGDDQIANARLIAAAPEMLDALKRFPDDSPFSEYVKQLIAKAEGKI